MARIATCFLCSFLLAIPLLGDEEPARELSPRDASWAQPIAIDGVPNLHQVSEVLYRSAQPTAAGVKNLQGLGIKTVINLRSFHSDRKALAGLGLRYEHLTMKAWHPEEKELARFLKIVMDPESQPVLVHCQHGADRTGTICAIYRMAVQGWTKEQALREMTAGGYGFHGVWENLKNYLEDLDIQRLRRAATIPDPASNPGEATGADD